MQKRNKQRDHYENRYNHNSYYAPYKKNSIDRKPINQPWWAKIYHPIIAGSIDGTDTKPHDRAIQRALEANYEPKPNETWTERPECTLFVSRLLPTTKEETIRKAFEQFGTIKKVKLVRDIVTGASKCYAFVEFKHRRHFFRAYEETKHFVIDGKKVLVDFERERRMEGWIPRRFGGGLGGNKNSGQLRFGGRDRPFKMPLKPDLAPPKEILSFSNYIFDDYPHEKDYRRRSRDERSYSRDYNERFVTLQINKDSKKRKARRY